MRQSPAHMRHRGKRSKHHQKAHAEDVPVGKTALPVPAGVPEGDAFTLATTVEGERALAERAGSGKGVTLVAPVREVKLPARRSADSRMNLKRAYQAFARSAGSAGSTAVRALSPSEAWPIRPYAASV